MDFFLFLSLSLVRPSTICMVDSFASIHYYVSLSMQRFGRLISFIVFKVMDENWHSFSRQVCLPRWCGSTYLSSLVYKKKKNWNKYQTSCSPMIIYNNEWGNWVNWPYSWRTCVRFFHLIVWPIVDAEEYWKTYEVILRWKVNHCLCI